jgi:transposase
MKMEARNIAQQYVIFFCVKLGNSVTTTHGNIQHAFGDYAISRAQASRWQNKYSEGRNLVEDEQRSGRPSAIRTGDNTALVREFFDLIY